MHWLWYILSPVKVLCVLSRDGCWYMYRPFLPWLDFYHNSIPTQEGHFFQIKKKSVDLYRPGWTTCKHIRMHGRHVQKHIVIFWKTRLFVPGETRLFPGSWRWDWPPCHWETWKGSRRRNMSYEGRACLALDENAAIWLHSRSETDRDRQRHTWKHRCTEYTDRAQKHKRNHGGHHNTTRHAAYKGTEHKHKHQPHRQFLFFARVSRLCTSVPVYQCTRCTGGYLTMWQWTPYSVQRKRRPEQGGYRGIHSMRYFDIWVFPSTLAEYVRSKKFEMLAEVGLERSPAMGQNCFGGSCAASWSRNLPMSEGLFWFLGRGSKFFPWYMMVELLVIPLSAYHSSALWFVRSSLCCLLSFSRGIWAVGTDCAPYAVEAVKAVKARAYYYLL